MQMLVKEKSEYPRCSAKRTGQELNVFSDAVNPFLEGLALAIRAKEHPEKSLHSRFVIQ